GGEVVAFVGMSGAGKSTLMDLLSPFNDVNTGRITLDGHDLPDLTHASLRAQIGLVTQDTFLFSDSVYYNIAYGRPDAPFADVARAARQAHAEEFILACPDSYDTLVGERGVRLSGGQRQRLAIARAFLKDPPVLILDEATSDLDAESEFMVQQALSDLMQGRTVLVIAHRLATVRNADRIVVIHEGRIAEVGRHDELLARDEETVRRLRHIAAGHPERIKWFDSMAYADRFNARTVARARRLSLPVVLRRLARARADLVKRLARLPPGAFRDPSHAYPMTE